MAKETREPMTKQRPAAKDTSKLTQVSGKELESIILKLSTEGMGTAMIGTKLRDMYGIPDVKSATGKTITQILKENEVKMEIPEDIRNLLRRVNELQKHLRENPKDIHNARGMALIEARIRRLVKYYQKEGVLPKTWKYSRDTIELQLK
jgi:small subunit ribosomal protein S15